VSEVVKPKGKGRQQLVMIILLFAVPPLVAYFVWSNLSTFSSGATNNVGTLVHPARPLNFDTLRNDKAEPLDVKALSGRWTFVIYGHGGCDEVCQKQLFVTRQTRISINKDMTRVRRLLIVDQMPDEKLSAMLAEQHKDLLVAVSNPASSSLLEKFQGDQFGISGKQYFLVDPIGNLMMFYDLNLNPHGVLKDLQKLLKVSQIG